MKAYYFAISPFFAFQFAKLNGIFTPFYVLQLIVQVMKFYFDMNSVILLLLLLVYVCMYVVWNASIIFVINFKIVKQVKVYIIRCCPTIPHTLHYVLFYIFSFKYTFTGIFEQNSHI